MRAESYQPTEVNFSGWHVQGCARAKARRIRGASQLPGAGAVGTAIGGVRVCSLYLRWQTCRTWRSARASSIITSPMAPPDGPHTPDSELLREQVRTRIASGALPQVAPAHLFGGHGDNQTCDVCSRPILPTQILYEVELIEGGVKGRVLHFHLACHAAWQLEVSDPGAA